MTFTTAQLPFVCPRWSRRREGADAHADTATQSEDAVETEPVGKVCEEGGCVLKEIKPQDE